MMVRQAVKALLLGLGIMLVGPLIGVVLLILASIGAEGNLSFRLEGGSSVLVILALFSTIPVGLIVGVVYYATARQRFIPPLPSKEDPSYAVSRRHRQALLAANIRSQSTPGRTILATALITCFILTFVSVFTPLALTPLIFFTPFFILATFLLTFLNLEAGLRRPASRRQTKEYMKKGQGCGSLEGMECHLTSPRFFQRPIQREHLISAVRKYHGPALLARQLEMQEWAGHQAFSMVLADPSVLSDDTSRNPLLLNRVVNRACAWQVRNIVSIPDPDERFTVTLFDLDVYPAVTLGSYPTLTPYGTTVTWAWFPSDDVLVLASKAWQDWGLWRSAGGAFKTGERAFDSKFTVRASSLEMAHLVLNPAVMTKLESLGQIQLVIDRGRITLATMDTWVDPAALDAFVTLLKEIVYSASAAEDI